MNAEEFARFGIDPAQDTCRHPWLFAEDMLRRVSRTFALNIKVLPKKRLRQPVLLAYLFCRMADTVEDSPSLPAQDKKRLLDLFTAIFMADNRPWLACARAFVKALPTSWVNSEDDEEYLCAHCSWVLHLYFAFPAKVRMPIAQCVHEMCEGMGNFALRQAQHKGQWLTIADETDLDRYCYFVAGVVGNMLCDLFHAQSPLIDRTRHAQMRQLAVSFGLGLQLVNIIKDATEDSGRKVCFIPMVWLRAAGFDQPQRLFAAEVDQTARAQAVQRMIDKAWRHLQDACNYTMLIPLLEPRLRLFCEWPLLMAAETLAAVQTSGSALFDPEHKVKIGRDAVARIVKHSSLWCWRPAWLPNRFVKLQNRSRPAQPAGKAST